MKLTQIIKRTLAAGALMISGCTYFNHIPDPQICNVQQDNIKDAEWANKYKGLHISTCLMVAKNEPFDKMTAEEVIKKVKTPFEAQVYCFWLQARNEGRKKRKNFHTDSFYVTHQNAINGKYQIDCSELAVAAAALLSDNGYPPLILRTAKTWTSKAHESFILRKKGRFHTIGGLYMMQDHPKGHESVHELVKKQFYPYLDRFSVYDVSDYFKDWKTSKDNVQVKALSTEKVK
jgi:hypothetical protein